MSVKIGTTISGTFPDGSGFPSQDHLIYAENAGVWWYFTLTSASDTAGNPGTHVIKSYVSSGADLATATWTAKTDSPNLNANSGGTSSKFWNGRSLGCLYLNHASGTDKDILHCSASIFPGSIPDAGNGVNGHIRAKLTATTITWGVWGQYITGSFNYPTGVPLRAGNCIASSPDNYIQAAASVYHQELDASVTTSQAADTGDTWDSGGEGTGNTSVGSALITNMSSQAALAVGMGISYGGGDTTPGIAKVNSIDSGTQVTMSATANNAQTAGSIGWSNITPGSARTNMVLDNTMTNQCDCYAFAKLASSKMLVVYDNGGTVPVVSPNLTNLRFTKGNASQAQGLWPATVTGDGDVFGTANTQDDDDWCLVAVDTTHIYCARRSGTTTIEVNSYSTIGPTSNTFSALASQPPALTGKVIKAQGGVMGVTDGIDMWLFVIDSTDNAIKYCRYSVSGASWDAGWTVVDTVDSTAKYLSGNRQVANGRAGLVYSVTNGGNFDTYVTQLFPMTPRRFLMGRH